MTKIKSLNLSPSFLSKLYDKGYDYAVGEKLGLIKKDTKSMADGRLLHGLLSERLGGEKVKIAISTFENFRTKEARNWRDSQPDDVAILSESKMQELNTIVDRVLNHENLVKYLSLPAMPEKTYEKQTNGFNVKGVLDLTVADGKIKTVFDWKFCSSKVFDKFTKEALYSHYDLQASVYDFLCEPTNIYFVAIENEDPHRIKVFHCDSSFLDSGAMKFDKAFQILQEANWRQPNFNIQDIGELMSWENYNG